MRLYPLVTDVVDVVTLFYSGYIAALVDGEHFKLIIPVFHDGSVVEVLHWANVLFEGWITLHSTTAAVTFSAEQVTAVHCIIHQVNDGS